MLAVHWRWRKQEASRAQVREEAPSARFHPSSSLSGSPGKAQKECIVLFSGQLPKAETTNLLQLRNSRPPATGRALSLGERTPRQPSPQGSRIQRYDRQTGRMQNPTHCGVILPSQQILELHTPQSSMLPAQSWLCTQDSLPAQSLRQVA